MFSRKHLKKLSYLRKSADSFSTRALLGIAALSTSGANVDSCHKINPLIHFQIYFLFIYSFSIHFYPSIRPTFTRWYAQESFSTKNQWVQIRVLTEAIRKKIFSRKSYPKVELYIQN